MATARWFTFDGVFTGPGADLPYDVPLLDDVTQTAYQAYALRRLTFDYTGPLVKVRRSTDNALLDVGTATNDTDLNWAALTAFIGANTGYITTWYDQSGNARNMVQATTTKQPKLVDAGALVTLGTHAKAAAQFLGSDCHLRHTSPGMRTLIPATGCSICHVHTEASGLVPYGESDATSGGGHTLPFYWPGDGTMKALFTSSPGTSQSPFPTTAIDSYGSVHADMLIKPTTRGQIYRDGVLKSDSSFTPTLPTTSTNATLGGWDGAGTGTVSSDYTGKIGEHILFTSNLDGVGIQKVATSQKNYFGI